MQRRQIFGKALAATASGIALAATRHTAKAGGPQGATDSSQAHGFVTTSDGTSLFFRDTGAGKPVVMVAGWVLPSDQWMYQMAALPANGFRCIAYDRRSHGRSGDPGSGYDFDTLADDLRRLLETLDLHEVTLVGHSMGFGEIARCLRRHGSDRVARLVAVAPSTPAIARSAHNPQGFEAALFDSFHAAWLADMPAWLDAHAQPFVLPETSAGTIEWLKRLALQTALHAAVACHRALEQEDFAADLRAIRLPTLIVHGDNDVLVPIDLGGRPTARLIPNARLVVYSGAPHGLFLTHKERLNRDLTAFAAA